MAASFRSVKNIFPGRPTLEGAGVRLRRAFGFREAPLFDPFLMFDDFGSPNPDDYLAGFPWHPHRGIETVTYVLTGAVAHGDSLGNQGLIGAGEVQWMTAGGGIIHQEMPERRPDALRGFQLWVNLPASQKMMKPRYRDIRRADIPEVAGPSGSWVKVIAGRYRGTAGPVGDIVIDPRYLDISLPGGAVFEEEVPLGHKAFACAYDGSGIFDSKGGLVAAGRTVLFGDGPGVKVQGGSEGLRFLLVSGKPIGEPVAWRGPIVMNTQDELDQAFEDYRNGTFAKF
jgi:redox-sensitive bicupin YhaK (pirin superfamily)